MTAADELTKKRGVFLAALDEQAARAAGFHALQGPSWDRRLKRLLALDFRYLDYLVARFVRRGSAKARLFWGGEFLWGKPEHSTSMHLYGVLEHSSEVRLARFLIRTLDDADIFFDIGANFGYFSLLAVNFIKPGRIFSFEPVPYVFESLAKNARSAGGIQPVNSAVSDRVGDLDFDQAPECRHTGSGFDEARVRAPGAPRLSFTKIKVSSTTVDEFCAERGLVPTVMKIDVEGAEKRVIEGARKTLASAAPSVIMEIWKPPLDNRDHRDAAGLLRDLGYRAHLLTEDGGLRPLDDAALEEEFSGGEGTNLVFRKLR